MILAEHPAGPAVAGLAAAPAAPAAEPHDAALHWARARLVEAGWVPGLAPGQADAAALAIDAVPIGDTAWASTWRLDGDEHTAWLKVLPVVQRPQLPRLLSLLPALGPAAPVVLAAEPRLGWLLMADHDGHAPGAGRQAFDDDLQQVALAYGRLQARLVGSPALGTLSPVRPVQALGALMAFLAGPAEPTLDAQGQPWVGARHFLGPTQAGRLHRLLQARLPLLQAFVEPAEALPPTLAHGDLHAQNVALRDDGGVVFFDWDEVAVAPAGACLHGLCGGSALACVLLAQPAMASAAEDTCAVGSPLALRLRAYVRGLEEGGYAPRATLLAALGGALCAGQAHFIARFGRFPAERDKAAAANTLRKRLADLLDLADWLAGRQWDTAQASVQDYRERGEWQRAHRLVQDQLAKGRGGAPWWALLGELSQQLADHAAAESCFAQALQLEPPHTAWQIEQARAQLHQLHLEPAQATLDAVLAREPQQPEALRLRQQVRRLRRVQAVAASPQGWPRLAITPQERRSGQLEPYTRALALDLMRRHGTLQLDGLFTPATMRRLQQGFAARYQAHFYEGEHPDALEVGDRRYMLTMELDELFGQPALLANPLWMPLMREMLGPDCILSACTAVVSLPGSADQRPHKDHSALFEEAGWQFEHPAFATQMILPLLRLDETTGATRMVKGSQRVPLHSIDDMPTQDPVVPLGSGVLLDYSVAHYGLGNRSPWVRPIINLIYSRPWFRDCRNYHRQPPLQFSSAWLEKAPPEVKRLVGWWDQERRIATQHPG